MRRLFPLLVIPLAAMAAGCGAARSPAGAHPVAPSRAADPAPADSLETFVGKVRQLAATAPNAVSVEASDPGLGAALRAFALRPGADTARSVAAEYERIGVRDRAHAYLMKAVRLEPYDAAAYDRLARLWRDWGLPHLALGDAHRARFYAPGSPVAHNTLGTVLQSLGRKAEARQEYARALELDPSAAYALNNLCYGWVLEGEAKKAVAACARALEIQPMFAAARNNLGLAHALDGDIEAAEAAFDRAGDRPSALYNLGVVHLARREYRKAERAFQAALSLRPTFQLAAVRARQARTMLSREINP